MKTEKAPPQSESTGIKGLDYVLRGGLPTNRFYLLQGDPGVGKTTIALQFLLEGKRLGQSVLYIALSETKEEVTAVAHSHGWALDGISIFELSAMEKQLSQSGQNTLFHPSEVELSKTTKVLMDEIERVKPARLALDSLSELRLLSENPLRYRRQMLALKQFLAGRNCTSLFLDDCTAEGQNDLQVESIAHGVVTLERRRNEYGIPRRTLTVDKLRGVKFEEATHDYIIGTGGVSVFPQLVAAPHGKPFDEAPMSTGVKEFDEILGGGLDRGTTTLLAGAAGTGKSTVAIQQAITAAERGEKALIFLFDENINTVMKRTSALGLPLRQHIDSGCIQIREIDPAQISPGELACTIVQAVASDGVRIVIIDSLGGYLQAMPGEKQLALHLHELFTFLRKQGVVTIITLAQHGLVGEVKSPIDVTYIADTVVLMRYFEVQGRIKKAVSVMKKRTGYHEETIREFRIDRTGIRVGTPLTDFHGVLGGLPTFFGKHEAILSQSK